MNEESKEIKYQNELIAIAEQIEQFRLKIYKEISDTDEDKKYLDDQLFKVQSDLRHHTAELVSLMEYKN